MKQLVSFVLAMVLLAAPGWAEPGAVGISESEAKGLGFVDEVQDVDIPDYKTASGSSILRSPILTIEEIEEALALAVQLLDNSTIHTLPINPPPRDEGIQRINDVYKRVKEFSEELNRGR